jgi:acylphosphatase
MDRGAPGETIEGQSAMRLEAIVIGRVQGVGFRWFVCDRAAALGLIGWVRNRADGSVEVMAQGRRGALAEFEAALRRGPAGAVVRAVHTSWSTPADLPAGFQIRGADHGGD